MLGLEFADPAAEWRFRRQFMANAVYIDLSLAFLVMVLPPLSSFLRYLVIKAAASAVASTAAAAEAAGVVVDTAAGSTTGAAAACAAAAAAKGVCWQGSLDNCAMWMLITLLLVATVKLDGYIKLRGVLCTIQRLQAALGLLFACYPSCDQWCPWLWRHRLLVVHMASTLARVPARSLLLGGLPVWLVATLTDASGLQEDCGQSVTCLYRAGFTVLMAKVAAGDPVITAQHIISALCSSSSATHLACVLFPTLLAAYLEVKARKAWSSRDEETPARVDIPADEHATPVCVPATAQQPSTGQTYSAALLGMSEQQPQNPLLQDPQCPGTPAVVAPVQNPGIARARAMAPQAKPQRIPQLSVHPRIQQRLNNGRPWYVSPVVSKLVQFSLQQPPNASTEDFIAVKQQLKAAVLSHYSSGSSEGVSDDSASGNSSIHSCQIAECTSFNGSWNLVIRAVLARRAAPLGSTRSQQQQEQQQLEQEQQLQLMQLPQLLPEEVDLDQRQLQQLARQVLQTWSGWSLLDVRQAQPGGRGPALAGGAALQDEPNSTASATAVYVTAALGSGWFLYPATIPLPAVDVDRSCYGTTSSSSASGSSKWATAGSTGSPATDMPSHDVDLCVSGAVVQRLLQSGSSVLRVVIAQQPQGYVLLDESWFLRSWNQQQRAGVDAAEGANLADVRLAEMAAETHAEGSEAAARTSGAPSAAAPSATATVTAVPLGTTQPAGVLEDLQIQLHVSWLDDRAMQQQQQQQQHAEEQQQQAGQAGICTRAQVLSVLILTDTALAAGTSGAAAAADTPPEEPPSTARRATRIVAQLPLLVLPARAQAELQGLLDAAVAGGMAESIAYQQLMPVLQDWAVLMLWSDGSGSGDSNTGSSSKGISSNSNSSSPSVSGSDNSSLNGTRGQASSGSSGRSKRRRLLVLLHQELTDAVCAFCDEFELTECYRLLSLQQWQRQHASVSAWRASTVEEELDQERDGTDGVVSAATATNLAELPGGNAGRSALHREMLGLRPRGQAAAAARRGFHAVASAPAASSAAAVLNGSHNSSKSSPGYGSLGHGSDLNGSSAKIGSTGSSKSSTLSQKLQAAAAELRQQQLGAAACTSLRTLLFGFPAATVERAYAVFKATLLYRQDGLAALLHTLIAAAALGQILWQVAQAHLAVAKAGQPLPLQQQQQQQQLILMGVLKTSFLAMFAAAHALTWMAAWCHSKHGQQQAGRAETWHKLKATLAQLVYWRELLMVLAPGLGLMLVYACMQQGGLLATAMQQLVQHSPQFHVILVVYVALVQPLFSAARLPVTAAHAVTLVLLQSELPNFAFTHIFTPWLEPQGTLAVLAIVALGVAGIQEAQVQNRFLRALQGAP